MASFQDKTLERLLEKIGKNVEERLTATHDSLIEDLLTTALEKDISLSRCRNFDKLGVSPIYNTKIIQEYLSSSESSLYSQYIRHYVPFVAPTMREKVFRPSLNLVVNWVKDNLMKLTITGLEESVISSEMLTAFSEGVNWASIIQELNDRFKTLHPEGWEGIIDNDDIVVKVSEIATDILYYTGLDNEIRKNLEHIKQENGVEYAIRISSHLKNGAFFAEIKNRGYFLESELETLKEIFPLLMCPTETCPEGFFVETLESCTKKQDEIIKEMIMGLPSVETENLPENSIKFESFLRYIISITYSDIQTT